MTTATTGARTGPDGETGAETQTETRTETRAALETGAPSGVADLATLARLQGSFLATIPSVDPTARVPWCGRWRVRDLVVHVARIHHWAAGQARRVQEAPLGRGPFDLAALYDQCATELRDTLAALDPEAPAWTLLGTGPVRFWHRRQVHETLVHLWDLRTAGGLRLDEPAALWADTVDEVVTVMQPRQERMGRMDPLDRPVRLRADDGGREWLLGAPVDGTADPGPGVAAGTTVTGPAQSLALLVWGRTTPDDPTLAVEGDRAALDDALGRRLTP